MKTKRFGILSKLVKDEIKKMPPGNKFDNYQIVEAVTSKFDAEVNPKATRAILTQLETTKIIKKDEDYENTKLFMRSEGIF